MKFYYEVHTNCGWMLDNFIKGVFGEVANELTSKDLKEIEETELEIKITTDKACVTWKGEDDE